MNVHDDDKKDDVMESLQTRLLTEDTISSASHVHHDEEAAQPEQIVVLDSVTRGEPQPKQYRDAPFAVLFVLHLVVIAFFAFAWGIPALDNRENSQYNYEFNLSGLLGLSALSTLASMMILAAVLAFMIQHTEILIQFSLTVSIAASLLFAIVFATQGFIVLTILYALLAALAACYAWAVWRRIPFAKANLVTATTAIHTNMGILGIAFALMGVFAIWSCLWMVSYGAVYLHNQQCDQDDCEEQAIGQVWGFLYLLSFCWTAQVIKNVLVVTVSGVVGTWWFAPHEAASYCSIAITDSFRRATSYSLGSICFGSLLMAIIQVLHQMVSNARRQGRGNDLLMCILECIVAWLESIAEYFNRYACIYIGLYGYDFLTAGKKVMQLFQERGWTTIINDQLVFRVLNLMSLVVAGLSGCAGMLIAYLIPSWVNHLGDNPYIIAFLLPFIIGAALSHVVFGVIASANDTVIVCFAESPNEFQANYPQLSQDMLSAWRQIYPTEFGL